MLKLRPQFIQWFAAVLILMCSHAIAEDYSALLDVSELSPEARRTYGRAARAVKDLEGYLTAIKFQTSAFIGTNWFGVSVGGIDALRDLEEGRGVDPETLGALYAGFAVPDVARHLNLERTSDPQGRLQVRITSPDGRLRYKGAVVRLYSPAQLRRLFDRRDGLRIDNPRQRSEFYNNYVFERRRRLGNLNASTEANQARELQQRYDALQPLLSDLQTVLQGETSASSIIGGASGQHYFGLSVGGINVIEDLTQTRTVDPESYAAIVAERVALDFANSFSLRNGQILYEGKEVRMYNPQKIEAYLKRRDLLTIQAQVK